MNGGPNTKNQWYSLLIGLIFLVGCARLTPVLSSSLSSASVSAPKAQSISSISDIGQPELQLTLPSGIDLQFLYDDVTKISSDSATATKLPGEIEIIDGNIYYIFNIGDIYGVKQRELFTGTENILFQTNEHKIVSFIRINETQFLFESNVSLAP